MTEIAPVLLLVAFVALVVAVLVGVFVLERKRRERLMQFAVMRGWEYVGEDPSLVDLFTGDPFGEGDDRTARNVLTGQESGRPFTAFDYSYETRSTDSKGHTSTTTHRFGVCAVALPVPLGTVEVVPENVLTRMAGAVGMLSDIDLESEDFNRRFRVRAGDRKLACDILTPRTMAYLISVTPEAWRIEGSHVVSWHPGRLDPAELVRTCAVLDRLLDGIPAFVWKDAGLSSGYDPEA